jgi:hypothetical protein
VPGCGKAAARGTGFCRDHRRTGLGAGEQRRLRKLLRDLTLAADNEERRLEAVFLQRALRGDYGELLDDAIRRVIEEAGRERGLAVELGALRVTLARVLGDRRLGPQGQARAVARLASAAIGVVEAQRGIDGGLSLEVGEELRRLAKQAEADAEAAIGPGDGESEEAPVRV